MSSGSLPLFKAKFHIIEKASWDCKNGDSPRSITGLQNLKIHIAKPNKGGFWNYIFTESGTTISSTTFAMLHWGVPHSEIRCHSLAKACYIFTNTFLETECYPDRWCWEELQQEKPNRSSYTEIFHLLYDTNKIIFIELQVGCILWHAKISAHYHGMFWLSWNGDKYGAITRPRRKHSFVTNKIENENSLLSSYFRWQCNHFSQITLPAAWKYAEWEHRW